MGNKVGAFPRRADYGPLPTGPDSGNTVFVAVESVRGPTGSSRLIQSSAQYNAIYGGASATGFSAGYEAVQTLLSYGTRKIQVIRVVGTGGGVAQVSLDDTVGPTMTLSALGVGTDANGFDAVISAGAKTNTFKLTVLDANGATVEVYDNMTVHPDSLSRITSNSQYVSAEAIANAQVNPANLPANGTFGLGSTTAGTDPAAGPLPADVVGAETTGGVKTGLKAFESCAFGRGIILAPDLDFDTTVRAAMQGLTEDKYFRIAYLSGAPAGSTPTVALADKVSANSTLGAGYAYPRLRKTDSATGNEKTIPAAAHIVGQWMLDVATTPAKAPAGLDYGFPGTLGPETYFNGAAMVDEAIAENLVANGINPIWALDCENIRCYGARSTATNLKWTYLHAKYVWIWLAERAQKFLNTLVFDTVTAEVYNDIEEAVYQLFADALAQGAFIGALPPQGETADPEKHAFEVVCSEDLQTALDKQNNNFRISAWFNVARTLETMTFDLSKI